MVYPASSDCLPLRISSGISSTFGILILTYITWKGLSAIYHHERILQFFKIMFLFYIIAAWLGVLSFLSYMTIGLCYNRTLEKVSYSLLGFSYFCLLFPVLLIILIARLHYTFHDSAYKIHPYILRIMYVVMGISIALNWMYTLSFVGYYLFSKYYDFYLLRFRFLFGGLFLYLILSCTLVTIFIQKLKQLIVAHSVSNFNPNVEIEDVDDVELSKRQTRLIKQVSKYLVISSFAFSTTFLVICGVFIGSAFASFDITTIQMFTSLVDGLCNTMCLYLQYGFASKDYRFMCRRCDRLCRRVLVKKMKNSMALSVLSINNFSYPRGGGDE